MFLYLPPIMQTRKLRLGEVSKPRWEQDALSLGEGGGVLGSEPACKLKRGRLRRRSLKFGAGCLSWLPSLMPVCQSLGCLGQDTFSAPSSCVRSLSHCHVLCAGSHGRWGGEGGSLCFCSCKAVFGSSVSCPQPRAWFEQLSQLSWSSDHLESAVSPSEPQFLSWVTVELGRGWGDGRWGTPLCAASIPEEGAELLCLLLTPLPST